MNFNLVINYYPTDKLSFIGGFDFITQEKSKLTEQDAAGNVISGMVSGRYKVNPKFSISARAEIFNDPEGVLSGTFVNSENSLTGIKSYGFTLGFEYRPVENAYMRLDSRYLQTDSKQKIFYNICTI